MPRDYSGLGLYGPFASRRTRKGIPKAKPLSVENPTPPSAPIRTPEQPEQPTSRVPKPPRQPSYWRAWSPSQEDMWTRREKVLRSERSKKGSTTKRLREEQRRRNEEQRLLAEEQQRTAAVREQGYASRVVPAEPPVPDEASLVPPKEKNHPYWRTIGLASSREPGTKYHPYWEESE